MLCWGGLGRGISFSEHDMVPAFSSGYCSSTPFSQRSPTHALPRWAFSFPRTWEVTDPSVQLWAGVPPIRLPAPSRSH